MDYFPAATRQEGTQKTADERVDAEYWRDCQVEGECLLTMYRRVTMNRSYGEQQRALHDELGRYTELAPRLRELIAAADQELLSLNRLNDRGRQQYAALLHYRTGLASLWDIVSPYLLSLRRHP